MVELLHFARLSADAGYFYAAGGAFWDTDNSYPYAVGCEVFDQVGKGGEEFPAEAPVGRVVQLVFSDFPAAHSEKHGFGAGELDDVCAFGVKSACGFCSFDPCKGVKQAMAYDHYLTLVFVLSKVFGSKGTVVNLKFFHIYLSAILYNHKRLYIDLLRIMQKWYL